MAPRKSTSPTETLPIKTSQAEKGTPGSRLSPLNSPDPPQMVKHHRSKPMSWVWEELSTTLLQSSMCLGLLISMRKISYSNNHRQHHEQTTKPKELQRMIKNKCQHNPQQAGRNNTYMMSIASFTSTSYLHLSTTQQVTRSSKSACHLDTLVTRKISGRVSSIRATR